MTFAAIDVARPRAQAHDATLLNWHAQAIAAQTLLNSHQVSAPSQPQAVPIPTTPATEEVPADRPSHKVIGLVAWLHSLETEMSIRGLAAPGAAPPDAP